MNNIENNASNLGDKLIHTASNVADGIKEASQSAVDCVKQNIHNQTLTEDATQYIQKGMDSVNDMGKQMKSTAGKYARECGHYISEKPIQSVAMGIGLGALLALILFQKKK